MFVRCKSEQIRRCWWTLAALFARLGANMFNVPVHRYLFSCCRPHLHKGGAGCSCNMLCTHRMWTWTWAGRVRTPTPRCLCDFFFQKKSWKEFIILLWRRFKLQRSLVFNLTWNWRTDICADEDLKTRLYIFKYFVMMPLFFCPEILGEFVEDNESLKFVWKCFT